MSAILLIASLAITCLYLNRKAERRRAARLARERREHITLMAEIGYTRPRAEVGPRDAIPAGHPGHTPFDETTDTEEH